MWSTTLFSVRGIDVKVHATFAVIIAIGAMQWGAHHGLNGALFGVGFTLALFACVLLHELGHSFVAQRFGFKVKEVVLLPVGGIASLENRPQSPKQEIAIAIAGPLVNLALAAVLGAGVWFSGAASHLSLAAPGKLAPSWQTFIVLLTASNLSLAVFNLLPFFPLDGGRVLRALLSLRLGERSATRWASGVGQAAGVGMVAFALVSGQLILGLIGLLIFTAASRERVAATLQPSLQTLSAAALAEVPAVELQANVRVGEAIAQLLRSRQDAFPVVADGRLLGVVLREELLLAANQPGLHLQSIRTLVRQLPELPSHLSAAEALKTLEELEAPLGIVTTPDYPLGFISREQVFAKLGQLPAATWPQGTDGGRSLRPSGSPDLPRNPA